MKRNSTITLNKYNQLISHIYSAATDTGQWLNTLKAFTSTFNSHSCLMRFQGISNKEVYTTLTYGLDPEYQKMYKDYYIHHDIITSAGLTKKTGTAVQTVEMMPDNYRKTMFYNEYVKPQSSDHIAGGILNKANSKISVVSVQRTDRAGFYSPDEMHIIETLLPHFQRAIEINQKLVQHEDYDNASADILNRLPNGIILLNKNKKPVFINKRAEAIIAANNLINASNNEILLGLPRENKILLKLITRANQTDTPQGGKLVLGSPPSASMVHLLVTPINQENQFGLGIDMPYVTTAIFIETGKTPDYDFQSNILKQIYDLTPAESRLVSKLVNGLTIEEIARKSSVSKETLRSQLKSCFRKTNSHSQTELVKLVLSGPAVLATKAN